MGTTRISPITLKKTVTIGDIITLDRAVNMDILSVVYFVMQIDPAEREANLENLRKALLHCMKDCGQTFRDESKKPAY